MSTARDYASRSIHRALLYLPSVLGAVVLTSCSDEVPTGMPPNTPPMAAFTASCADLICTLTDASTDADGTIQAHAWEFGDGSASTETSPVHEYAAPGGQFTVRLTVTDDEGETGTTTRDVTVTPPTPANRAPVADFTVACFALTCVFTDQSTEPDEGDAIASRAWDFGDGERLITDQTPIHSYADPGGQFTTTLTVTDNHGASSIVGKEVAVMPAGPSMRSGIYERETPHGSPDHHSRYELHDDGRFEMRDRNGADSVTYTGSWVPVTGWGGWPVEPDFFIAFHFDDFDAGEFCGEGYGTFFDVAGAMHMAVALCRQPQEAGLEEGFYVSPTGSGDPGPPPPQPGQLAIVRDGRIQLVNTDGSGLVPVSDGPDDLDPTWSPDGSRLAFTRGGAEPGIYVVDADGSNLARRTTSGHSPAWSPDGESLVFECWDERTLCTVEVDDPAAPVRVIPGIGSGQIRSPAWSPDGTRIAHSNDYGLYDFWFDIWVVGPDGSGFAPLITHTPAMANPYEFYQPAWSPDGQRIALVTCPWAWTTCSSSVVSVMNADGTDITWLAVAAGLGRPAWSPDGQVITFASANAIEWVSADGTQRGRIVEGATSPSWRP